MVLDVLAALKQATLAFGRTCPESLMASHSDYHYMDTAAGREVGNVRSDEGRVTNGKPECGRRLGEQAIRAESWDPKRDALHLGTLSRFGATDGNECYLEDAQFGYEARISREGRPVVQAMHHAAI